VVQHKSLNSNAWQAEWVYSELAMRKTKLFATLALASAVLLASPAGLSVTCGDGTGEGGNCAVGRVTFSSQNYGGTVHVTVVRDANGEVYDNFDYDASAGEITFTETLIPHGSYTVTLSSSGVDYTQFVVTGGY